MTEDAHVEQTVDAEGKRITNLAVNYACLFELYDYIWRVEEFTLCLFKQSDVPDCGITPQ